VTTPLAAAYDAAGDAWQAGPARIYDRLSQELVARCPGGVAGRHVLDLGAGTGAAGRAAAASGAASIVAVDLSEGMLRHGAGRPPAAVGDCLALPFASGSLGAVIAAFSLNHLTDPAQGLAEAARVLALGGGLVASAYAAGDDHPVKAAVDAASAAGGWRPPSWYATLKADAMPRLATVEGATAAAQGLPGATVEVLEVAFPDLEPADLVAWRLGMAQFASFLAAQDPSERADLVTDALARLGPSPPPLVRSCTTITWRRPA
jgi:ubiquinone/menaquinone biosynthesis C-methylase UbiE